MCRTHFGQKVMNKTLHAVYIILVTGMWLGYWEPEIFTVYVKSVKNSPNKCSPKSNSSPNSNPNPKTNPNHTFKNTVEK